MGLIDNKLEWTDEEKALARTLLGAIGSADYATKDVGGISKVNKNFGIDIRNDGIIYIVPATNTIIDAKAVDVMPITPKYLDYSVMKALTDCKNHTWTDEEKASALELLGGVAKTDSALVLYGTDSSGEQVAYNYRSANKTGNTIVGRTASGTIKCADPIVDDEAATKKYVDDLISQLRAEIEALKG